MAIKLSIDLSDATFAELSAVIGYAHQLGVDADEKINFEGNVLSIEFDGDLEPDDVFPPFEDAEMEYEGIGEEGPIYVEDLIDEDDEPRPRRHRDERPYTEDVVGEIGEAVNNFVQGLIASRGRGHGPGYGNFGGPFGPFGPGRRF
ncbi:hypothetical protein SFC07_01240 [Corynebacterium callunae]|uniref:hypothetical protein n=1 Tax=Corynebacterium callunae TaxID=1721 RepID=UPI0039825E52